MPEGRASGCSIQAVVGAFSGSYRRGGFFGFSAARNLSEKQSSSDSHLRPATNRDRACATFIRWNGMSALGSQSAWAGTSAGVAYLVVALGILWEWGNWALEGPYSPMDRLEVLVGPLCHHLPDRTLSLSGKPLPVCARCTGVWLGWLASALIAFLAATRRWLASGGSGLGLGVVAAGAVGAALAVGELIGWFECGNLARVVLGVPLGLTAGWLLIESAQGMRRGEGR